MRRVMLILGAILFIGMVVGCPEGSSNVGSFDAGNMVQSFYQAINDGDTAKAQSYVSPGNAPMLELTEAMVSVMAGKIKKVEILDTIRSDGEFGGPPSVAVYVRITCDPGVPLRAPGYPRTWLSGNTCGDYMVGLYKYGSGWKIEGTFS